MHGSPGQPYKVIGKGRREEICLKTKKLGDIKESEARVGCRGASAGRLTHPNMQSAHAHRAEHTVLKSQDQIRSFRVLYVCLGRVG